MPLQQRARGVAAERIVLVKARAHEIIDGRRRREFALRDKLENIVDGLRIRTPQLRRRVRQHRKELGGELRTEQTLSFGALFGAGRERGAARAFHAELFAAKRDRERQHRNERRAIDCDVDPMVFFVKFARVDKHPAVAHRNGEQLATRVVEAVGAQQKRDLAMMPAQLR